MEIVFLWIVSAVLGAVIGNMKGRAGFGLLLGLLLGLIGVLVIAVLPANEQALVRAQTQRGMKACPHCAELIQGPAHVCRFCGRDV